MNHPSTWMRGQQADVVALILAATIPLAADRGSAGSPPHPTGNFRLRRRTGPATSDHVRDCCPRSPDRGERTPGRSQQGERAAAAVQGRRATGQTVWFVLLDASDAGLAHDLGINFAPKLANIGIGCPGLRADRDPRRADPAAEPSSAQATVHFQGAPDFSPTRIAEPGPDGFPLAKFQPGAVAGPGYSPFIRIEGSSAVYSAPIVATGDGPFDVDHHTNTGDRVLDVHIAGPSQPGQFAESWVDMLFVKGFDAGQPIVYISTDAGQPLTAVLERSTYVPALDKAAYNGGDDFLGSARERLFGFINGQTGADNKQAQGFVHLAKDGHVSEDASASNKAFIDALRNGGDLLNVFGDFPTQDDPRHAQAYSPLWDAQLGLWTDKAVQQGLNKRQIDEVQVFNLAATRPDLLTGVDPATGQPAPYRLGRRRHQLRGARLHQQGTQQQPRRTRSPTPSSHPR